MKSLCKICLARTVSILIFIPSLINCALIKTKLGSIQGIEEETTNGIPYYAFLGVPYAAPPINDLRFKDPTPFQGWQGIFDASQMPDYCIQNSVVQERLGNYPFVGSEDCLYLNIFTPKGKHNLPVMVYLHGGAFYRGGAKEYGPTTLLNEDVILVVPQYRLGVFGFLSTEDSIVSGNFGLKDQNLALRWVQDNIESFGGNPRIVTLFGQSAGGAAVHYHLMSPSSKGLFSRAIIQSGTALCPWAQNSNHRSFATNLGENFHCPVTSSTYLTCLQQIDQYEMLRYASNYTKFYISPNFFTPRVDGNFIPKKPEDAMNQKLPEIDLIAGIVRDEGAAALESMKVLENDFENLLPLSLLVEDEEDSAKLAGKIFRKYFGGKKISNRREKEFVKMIGERYFDVCHQLFVHFYSKRLNSKLFLYEFNYKPESSPFNEISSSMTNYITHAEELGLLFNGYGIFSHKLTNNTDLKMRFLMAKLWTNFAIYGNPTPDDSLGFAWKSSSREINHLNINISPKMEKTDRNTLKSFWMTLPLKQNALLFGNNWLYKTEL